MIRLIKNISLLCGVHAPVQPLRNEALAHLPAISDAWLTTEGAVITGFGKMNDRSIPDFASGDPKVEIIDASGSLVLPCWVDSHTHLVFAASRENEFVDKIRGLTYAQIAEKGGGILNSAQETE